MTGGTDSDLLESQSLSLIKKRCPEALDHYLNFNLNQLLSNQKSDHLILVVHVIHILLHFCWLS